MPTWDAVTREHVLRAVGEHDRLGKTEFGNRYPFGPANGHVLVMGRSRYDSTAILGVAYGIATGRRLAAGTIDVAGRVLRDLGFHVETTPKTTGTYRTADGAVVDMSEALPVWASAARERLIRTARAYHTVITQRDLAAAVQTDTGIRTTSVPAHWIGTVLGLVADRCAAHGEPLLSALCVNQEGSVGPGYAPSVTSLRGLPPTDPDSHAATERLACHRAFGAGLPAGGGRAALAPAMQSRLERAAKQAARRREEERQAVCPRCFLELPLRGRCTGCDG